MAKTASFAFKLTRKFNENEELMAKYGTFEDKSCSADNEVHICWGVLQAVSDLVILKAKTLARRLKPAFFLESRLEKSMETPNRR